MNNFSKFINVLSDYLRSIKIAVGFLAVIVLASSIGTLIPQRKPYEFYINEHGPSLGKLIWHSGFADIYHHPLFLGLLAWVLVSMVVCSLFHLKNVLLRKPATKIEDINPHYNQVVRSSLELSGTNAATDSVSKTVKRLSEWLEQRSYRVSTEEGENETNLMGEKAAFSRFGAFTIHWGCVIILAGGFLSTLLGTHQRLDVGEGETIDVDHSPYKFKLHKFAIEKYGGAEKIKDLHKGYHCKISILDGAGKTIDAAIEINEPFVYDGFRFYQMQYTVAVQDLRIRLQPTGSTRFSDHNLKLGVPLDVPEFGIKITAVEFLPDFVFDKGRGVSRSEDLKNPAVRLQISKKDGVMAEKWVFPDVSGSFHRGKNPLPFKIRMVSYEPRYSIGLKIIKDPGRLIIYLGYIVLIIGTFLSCTLFHRRLFLKVTRSGEKATVDLVGVTGRNRIAFEDELVRMRELFEAPPESGTGES